MARYGANELFNPGGRRKKKKEGVTTGSSSSLGSFGSMAHSKAPDALALLGNTLALGKEINEMMEDKDKKTPGNGTKKKIDPKNEYGFNRNI